MFVYNKKPETLPKFLTKKEVSKFFNAFTKCSYHERFYCSLFKTMYYSGMRISEAINLKIYDINWKTEQILVRDTKNGTEHLAVLHPALKSILEKWIKYLTKQFPNTPYLFPTFNRHPLSSCGLARKYFKKKLKKAGLNEFYHPHSLRHSFAIHLLNKGTDIRLISQLLNHKNINSTMVYTYCATENLLNEVKKLGVV